jgi:hypothetical protein
VHAGEFEDAVHEDVVRESAEVLGNPHAEIEGLGLGVEITVCARALGGGCSNADGYARNVQAAVAGGELGKLTKRPRGGMSPARAACGQHPRARGPHARGRRRHSCAECDPRRVTHGEVWRRRCGAAAATQCMGCGNCMERPCLWCRFSLIL